MVEVVRSFVSRVVCKNCRNLAAMAYTLEQTPTWAVAAVCTVIVFVSVLVERLIHYLGKVRISGN